MKFHKPDTNNLKLIKNTKKIQITINSLIINIIVSFILFFLLKTPKGVRSFVFQQRSHTLLTRR